MAKVIFGLFFAFALISCFSQNTAEASNPSRNRTTITDLPLEIFFIIYGHLNMHELNIVAKLSQFHYRAASTAFKDQFGEKLIIINENGIHIELDGVARALGHSPIHHGDMDVMYSTLKWFGHLIKKLKINYTNFRRWEAGQINARISKYLKNSLTKIILYQFKSIHFKNFIGPFENVEFLKIDDCFINANTTHLPNVFPALRALKFSYNDRLHPSVYEHHFVHLEEVHELSFQGDAQRIDRLLQLNPQLLTLNIGHIEWGYLKTLSETLMNLEELRIGVLSALTFVDGSEIRFYNLKSLTLWSLRHFPQHVATVPMKFGDKFEEFIDYTLRNRLLDFISPNKHLKKLATQNYEFQRIAEELPMLEVFCTDFQVYYGHDMDKLVAFIGMAKNLKRIELRNSSPAGVASLLQKVSNEWEQINDHGTSVLIRMIPDHSE